VFILINKPYQVLCQFTDPGGRPTLAHYIDARDVYPAGRLDLDSEGLVVLTNNGRLQARISQRGSGIQKRYWVQVEGAASAEQINALLEGVALKDGLATAVAAKRIEAPAMLWDRNPPIRYRKTVADSWLEISLTEGRNRQVRRMTAAAGLPTLRLIRCAVGPWTVEGLAPGDSLQMPNAQAWRALRR